MKKKITLITFLLLSVLGTTQNTWIDNISLSEVKLRGTSCYKIEFSVYCDSNFINPIQTEIDSCGLCGFVKQWGTLDFFANGKKIDSLKSKSSFLPKDKKGNKILLANYSFTHPIILIQEKIKNNTFQLETEYTLKYPDTVGHYKKNKSKHKIDLTGFKIPERKKTREIEFDIVYFECAKFDEWDDLWDGGFFRNIRPDVYYYFRLGPHKISGKRNKKTNKYSLSNIKETFLIVEGDSFSIYFMDAEKGMDDDYMCHKSISPEMYRNREFNYEYKHQEEIGPIESLKFKITSTKH
jgi:hypothetical protein